MRVSQTVWPSELAKWTDFENLTHTILHGPQKRMNLNKDVDIYLINPEGLLWLLQPGMPFNFDALCVDESTRFKNSQSKRFKLLRPYLPRFKRRWILTGTPNPNGIEDLFSQIYMLDLGRSLERFITHFRKEYMEPDGYSMFSWKPKSDAYERILPKIAPLILQLSAEDYLQMPELVYRNLYVDLPKESRQTYLEVENNFYTELAGEELAVANIAAAGTKCRQIANGAVYGTDKTVHEIHNEKLDALESFVEELSGKPCLLLYEFIHDRERITARLGSVPTLGDMAQKEFQKTVDRFNAGEIPVLLGHPGTVGFGLNLQGACHHICWFGIPWNLEFYDQAIARVYRQGQKESHVFVYHIVARDTLDEVVMRSLTSKDREQQGLLHSIHEYRRSYLHMV
jgi:SNF2 family DNA or RNA helicase